MRNKILILPLILSFLGCGIKGAPTPPQSPFFIGSGKKVKNASSDKNNEKQKTYKKKNVKGKN